MNAGAPPAASRRLNLSVQYACNKDGLPSREQVRRWARATLDAVDAQRGGQVTVRFVEPAEGQELNRDYRGKDYATNVLSFPYDTEPVVMGDLIVCAAVVAREAVAQGKPLEHHHAHLVVHGMLHLQGFDHEDDDEAEAMEALETDILASLGYPDPYAAEKDSPAPRVHD
ncbi:putative rRNA maturation factor [Oryzomicrobium terrae]|uniref:Endoribonuclease YbeY n=1 Tax=Oryzomicrobium terrae TaxID=1735038 RepID=A0A5C1E5S3_9RHOO|nr:rRNA maturation RNase YbeY [Oryzomicrobium terrae]QEL63909.1 putative rRNA maturation factor [Oryzomicrobium terrae]